MGIFFNHISFQISLDKKPKVYISRSQIKKRIKELGKKLNKDYKGKKPIFIGVLNGSFMFLSDLIREIKVDCEVDFFKLSSYGDSKISSGEITLLKDLNCQVEDQDIVIVEDIIDTGLSIKYIRDLVMQRKPKSLKFVTLLYKKDVAKIDFKIDYVAFKIKNDFVIGYGLDYAQKYRNLKEIYVL